ncbi:hypothetical protein DPMN_104265 [Dreissena polymorpha]|uniref:Uncharacterized protein n=1 Tax=Dreissena polymorpha TaxID=45954 RepID=A0A9D4K100_DREPO|nr:hypothetical protein DPMN_104265 [Dreissena polymorpha]
MPEELSRLVDDLMSRLIKLENQDTDERIRKLEDQVKCKQLLIESKEDLDTIEIETGRTDRVLHQQDRLQSDEIEKGPPRYVTTNFPFPTVSYIVDIQINFT